jgi:hypothetical protein
MPRISESRILENQLSQITQGEGNAKPFRKPLRGEYWKWDIGHVYRLLGLIAFPFRESQTNSKEAINLTLIFINFSPLTTR